MPPRKSTQSVPSINSLTITVPDEPEESTPPATDNIATIGEARRVRVVQLDDRPIVDELVGRMRTWRGGDSHGAIHAAYTASNPPPARRSFWTAAAVCNAFQCKRLSGWSYEYVCIPAPESRHASWCKVRWILDSWDSFDPAEAVVVMDSDAWIRDPPGLEHLFRATAKPCLVSGEPKCAETVEHWGDVMNAGFTCFVKDDRVKAYFEAVWSLDEACARYAHDWPREQALQGKAYTEDVAGCQGWMEVLPVAACNTPAGTLVSHCWYKDLTYDLVVDDLLSAVAQDAMSLSRPTLEFVVARFNEDVNWVYEWLPYVDRVTIYNKGEPMEIPAHPKIVVKPSPNVGRESHAYADHFATTKDVCDAVVCTQARWEDHMSPAEFEEMVKTRTRKCVHGLDVSWSSTPMAHFGFTVDTNHSNPMQPMQPAGMSMAKYYLKYVADDSDDIIPEGTVDWWHNGIFLVSKAAVKRHAPEKYDNIRQSLSSGSNPESGIMMERLWKLLFDLKA